MQHSKHTGLYLKRKITASLLSLAIIGTGVVPLVSTVAANAAEDGAAVGADYVVGEGTTNGADIFWANATYYDYLSDNEVKTGGKWRDTIKAGTGFNGSVDDWYPYYLFNRNVVKPVANSSWTPLVFGNFCNTDGAYNTSGHHPGVSNGYVDATSDYNIGSQSYTFNYAANNSNGLSNYYQSYQGLMSNQLGAGNTLLLPNNSRAPYFDASQLGSYAKVIKSAFPFTQEDNGEFTMYDFNSTNAEDNVYFTWENNEPTSVNYGAGAEYGVLDGMRYFMNPDEGYQSGYGIFPFNNSAKTASTQGKHYIYASSSSWGTNIYAYFYAGDDPVGTAWPGAKMSTYGDGNNVRIEIPSGAQGLVLNNGGSAQSQNINDLSWGAYWMDGNTAKNWDTKPDDAGLPTENLDYGFGINMDVKFRVPKGGRAKDKNGVMQDIQFNFSGDDDLWLYITDETDSSKSPGLVLDMGGDHKLSTGNVKFLNNKITATVDDVYGKGKDVKTFDFDYSHTYAMHIFYMERGMLESNCHMSFSMVPLGNNVVVNEKINTTKVNPGLADDVSALKAFSFTPSQNGTTSWTKGLSYNLVTADTETQHKDSGQNSVELASDQSFYVPNFFSINDQIGVTQTRGESVLKYNTNYIYKNNTTGETLASGSKPFEGADASVATGEKFLSNTGDGNGDRFEFAELEASFENTPIVDTFSVTKESVDFMGNPLTEGDKYERDAFSAKVLVNLAGDGEAANFKSYDLSYSTTAPTDSTDLSALPVAAGGVLTIKNGETYYFPGIPENAQVKVVEQNVDRTHFDEESYSAAYVTVGQQNGITVTNPRVAPADGEKVFSVSKEIFTDGHEEQDGATLGAGYTFRLSYGDTVLDTKTITDRAKSEGSAEFKKIIFTCDEDKANEANGIFYVDPAQLAEYGGELTYVFTVTEVLTDEQGEVIYQPDPIDVAVCVYYDKENNELTTDHPVADTSYSMEDPSFTNVYKTGSVSIYKYVNAEEGEITDADKNKEFTANVTFSFENGSVGAKTYLSGVPFYYTVKDGDSESETLERLGSSMQITLKHNRVITFSGLPYGTIVRVEEVADPEYAVSYDGQEVKIEDEYTSSLYVINTKQKTGSVRLGVRKALNNADVAAKAGLTVANAGFRFKLTETTIDSTSDYTETVTGTGTAVYFSSIPIEHAGTRTFAIEELPYTGDANVSTDSTVYTVTVVTEKDQTNNELKVKSVTYKKGETVVYTTDTGVVNVDNAFAAVFTNDYAAGSVSFQKQVIDANGEPIASDTDAYTVNVELQYPNEDGYTAGRAFTYNNGKTSADGTVTVKHGDTVTIEKLPVGTKVRVTETESKGAVVSYQNNQNELMVSAAGATAALPASTVIYNQKADLEVPFEATKTLIGKDLTDDSFSFWAEGESYQSTAVNKGAKVTFPAAKIKIRQSFSGTEEGVKQITSSELAQGAVTYPIWFGETADASDQTLRYSQDEYRADIIITAAPEASGKGYTYSTSVSYFRKDGDEYKPINKAEFVNEWKTGSVEIIKTVKDSDGADVSRQYSDLTFKVKVMCIYPGGCTLVDEPSGYTVVDVKPGTPAYVRNLPVGTNVLIEEVDTQGMTPSYSARDGIVTSDDPQAPLSFTVTNTRQAPGEVTFPVQFRKELTGYALSSGEFSFTLNGEGYAADTAENNDANGLIDFGTVTVRYAKTATDADTENHIVYLTDSDFNNDNTAALVYTAAETPGSDGSIIYDSAQIIKTAVIKRIVTASQTTLELVGVSDVRSEDGVPVDQDPVFVNRKVGPVSVTKVTKQADGSDLDTDRTFTAVVTFKLPGDTAFQSLPFTYQMSDVNGIFTLGSDGKVELKNSRTVTFGGLPYGTEMKVVEEADPNYSTAYSAATATVGGQTSTITVTNTLQQPGQVVLPFTKEFSANALLAGVNDQAKGNKFVFRMTGDSSNPVPALAAYDETVTLDQFGTDGKLITTGSFPAINFPAEFTYSPDGTTFKFLVSETAAVTGNDADIVYDDAVFEVTYTVRQTADGLDISAPAIVSNDQAADAVTFRNGYKLGNVIVEKVVEDYDGEQLTPNAVFPVTLTVTYPNGETGTFNGRIGFSEGKKQTYTVADLPRGTKVAVTETDAQGMTASVSPAEITIGETAQVVTVTNKRTTPAPVSVQIPATKLLQGGDIKDYDKAFTFKLTGNGINLTAQNDAEGKILFDAIGFRMKNGAGDTAEANTILIDKTAFGTGSTVSYTFNVTEEKLSRTDMTTDSKVAPVTVTVTKTETLSGITLSASFDAAAAPTFTNYLRHPDSAVLPVSKAFTESAAQAGINTESKGNKFSFRMVGDASNPVAALAQYDETVTLDQYGTDGKLITDASFPAISFPADFTYAADGTAFRFVVSEVKSIAGNDADILYDTHAFEVIYTVRQTDAALVISEPQIKKFTYDPEQEKYVNGVDADSVSFTNDYPTGEVTVSKSLKDYDGADLTNYAGETFAVTVTITKPDGSVTTDKTTISAAEGKTYTDLPYGTTVSVEETDAKGMISAVEPATVTVSKDTPAPAITVTNTRSVPEPVSVRIPAAKLLEGADIANYNQAFLFKLTGNGIELSAKNDATGAVLFDAVTFRMKNGADDTAEANTILIDKAAFAESSTIAYTFNVTEIPADRADITFDGAVKTVTVNVTKTETLSGITLSAMPEDQAVPTFTNTKLGKVTLTKKALDIDGSEITPDVDFKFTASANGETISNNIIINLSKQETSSYTTPYLPVGTVVTFTETDKAGFENAEAVKTVTVTDDTDGSAPASVGFVNRRPQPGQTGAVISVLKQAEGFRLSDGDFSFTAKGRGLDETKTNAADGSVSFSEITYKYTKGSESDIGSTVYLRDSDFTDGKAVLSYTVTEVKGDNADVIYADNTVTANVTVTKAETASSIVLSADVAYPDGRSFTNPVRKGSATIIKKDQNGDPTDGVEFTLYKVTADGLSRDEVFASGAVVDRKVTKDGQVTFSELDLYVNGSQTLSGAERQWYCFAETDPGDSHNLNSELTFFRLPQQGVYDVEYTYMNGKITSPTSGGTGTLAFTLAGSVLVLLAALALAGYVFFVKAPRKKSARHSGK